MSKVPSKLTRAAVTRDVTHRCSDDNVVSLCADREKQARRQLDDRLAKMKPAELARQYPGEFNSYHAMQERCRAGRARLHEGLDSFPKFLNVLGPKPSPTFTLDRIDNDRREYAEDNVRWASKETQATNRSSTIMLRDLDGEMRPLTIIAKRTGQKPNTLRQRHARGWTDEEIITGKRTKPASAMQRQQGPWPEEIPDHGACERLFAKWKRRYPRDLGANRTTFLAAMAHHRARRHDKWLSAKYPDEFGQEANPYGRPSPGLLQDDRYKRWQACLRLSVACEKRMLGHKPSSQLLESVKKSTTFGVYVSSLFIRP